MWHIGGDYQGAGAPGCPSKITKNIWKDTHFQPKRICKQLNENSVLWGGDQIPSVAPVTSPTLKTITHCTLLIVLEVKRAIHVFLGEEKIQSVAHSLLPPKKHVFTFYLLLRRCLSNPTGNFIPQFGFHNSLHGKNDTACKLLLVSYISFFFGALRFWFCSIHRPNISIMTAH